MAERNEKLLDFAASSFSSVWALEMLLLLKREPRPWPQPELVQVLRASELVVSNACLSLLAAGLVSVDETGAAYRPASAELSTTIDQLVALYSARPNAVRRAIIASASGGATAFADAFKLRKD
ncbi:MAG: hypothetical protein V4513_01090 [Pseudomonadota bacterium]